MMALDAEPFSIVERNGFIRLMNYICPRYIVKFQAEDTFRI